MRDRPPARLHAPVIHRRLVSSGRSRPSIGPATSEAHTMSRIPKLRSGGDIKSLPLTPADGFLLSRLDATADEQELAAVTGFAVERVVEMLDRLTSLGAIEYARAGAGAPQPQVPAATASQTRVRATQAPPAARPPR